MSNIAITPATVLAFNTNYAAAAASATSSVADTAEVFEVLFTGKPSKVCLIFSNANSHGTYTYSVAAGVFGLSGAAVTGSVAQNKPNDVIQIETGRVLDADGKMIITLTPASGKRLATDHAATIRAIGLA